MRLKRWIKKRVRNVATTALALFFALLMVVSSAMTALAWSDFTQSKTNDFRGTVGKTTVTLHKYEKDSAGNILPRPVANAEFFLFKQGFNGLWNQINGLFSTDASGKITVDKLNSGHYKFVEQNPGYGYEYDKNELDNNKEIREYPFTISPDDADGLAIVKVDAYNRRLRNSLEITKTVEMNDGSPLGAAQLAQNFVFTVNFADGGTYDYTVVPGDGSTHALKSGQTLTLKHGQKAVFAHLPVALYYEVYETAVPDYTISSTDNSGSIALNAVRVAAFTNTYGKTPSKQTILIVKKVVEGEIPNSETSRRFGFTVTINGVDVHFFLKANQERRFVLDSGDTYSVKEDDPFPWGYIQSGVVNGAGTACEPEITVVYTNTYIGDIWVVVDGEKTWDTKGDAAAQVPLFVTVQLLADGQVCQSAIVKPNNHGKWLYSFHAPKYDGNGREILYTVKEIPVPGFITQITGYDIHNTWVETVTAAPAKVQKTIAGTAPAAPDTFSFSLTPISPNAPMPAGTIGGVKTITLTGEGSANFGDILFANPGVFTYEIKEIQGTANCAYDNAVYSLTVTVTEDNGKLAVQSTLYQKQGDSAPHMTAAFTNRYSGPDQINVSVRKAWAGVANSAQPTAVSVQLYRNGDPHSDPVTLNADNNWRHLWQNLEKGPAWTVNELDVPQGYTPSIDGDAASGFVITNSYAAPNQDEILLAGQKIWHHGTNPIPSRPGSITVHIKDGDTVVASATISETTHWQWSFKLPRTRPDGSTIHYTLDEDPVTDYEKAVDGYNIVNTHKTSAKEFITLDGQKLWDYGDAPAAHRPAGVQIHIMQGAQIVKTLNITAADDWRWTVSLPKHDANGTEIYYSVDESRVPYYAKSIDGTTITNSYKGPDYPGDPGPNMGDDYPFSLWLSLAALSAAGLALSLFFHRRTLEKASKGRGV